MTNAWLDSHFRAKGPLGAHYLKFAYIMEGDTPAFLGLIANGLNSGINPSWRAWGGRYVYRQPYGETHPIWTQGGDQVRNRNFISLLTSCIRTSPETVVVQSLRDVRGSRSSGQ